MSKVYTDESGAPLVICPHCQHDLTAEEGVLIEFVSGTGVGHWGGVSHLDENGVLLDDSGDVDNGLHSATYCNNCDEMLINLPGVVESDDDNLD